MTKHKVPVVVEVHQVVNWVITIALLMFSLWILNMYVSTKSIIKEDRQLFNEVKLRLDKTEEYLRETRSECALKVLPETTQEVVN